MALSQNRSGVSMRVEMNPAMKDLGDILELTTRDMTFMRDKIDARFRSYMKKQFASEGMSGGAPWQSLSPKYAAWKARKFPGRKIMALTGKTRRSLTNKTNPDHVAEWRLKPRPAVTVGTAHKTPAYHTPLSAFKNPRLPNRDVMQTTPAQDAGLIEIPVRLFKDKARRFARAMKAWRAGSSSGAASA